MTGPDYPIEHFKLMTEIAGRLKELPAQMLEHTYHYSAFGSWFFIYQRDGKKYRITLEGRDYFLTLEKPAVEWIKKWETVTYKQVKRDSSVMVNEVISLILSSEK